MDQITCEGGGSQDEMDSDRYKYLNMIKLYTYRATLSQEFVS
jgi:hypothetical protein